MQLTKPKLPKGIKPVNGKGGKVYYYHRKTNTRIDAMLGTPEFAAIHAELEEGILRAKINGAAGVATSDQATLSALPLSVFTPGHPEAARRNSIWMVLLNAFERSTDFDTIGKSWRRDISVWANAAADRWPDMTAEEAGDDALYAMVDDWRTEIFRAGKAATADRISAVLRRLTKFGRKKRILTRNVLAEKFDPLRTIGGRVEITFPDAVFTPAALKRLGDQDCTDALELGRLTGARRGDLCSMQWSMIDAEGWLSFEQAKVKNEVNRWVDLPVFALPQLGALLKRIKARQKALGYTGPYILTSTDPTGHKGTCALSGGNLNKKWQAIKSDPKNKHLAALHLHDLRGTLASLLDEADCTDKQIAAVTGHAVKGDVPSLAKYRKISRQNALVAYTNLAKYLGGK